MLALKRRGYPRQPSGAVTALALMIALCAACGNNSPSAVQTANPTAAGLSGGTATATPALLRPTGSPAPGAGATPPIVLTPAPAADTPEATPASSLTDAEAAYLDRVDTLAGRIGNSTELSAITQAMNNALEQFGQTGTFDATAANAALAPALSFMRGIGAGVGDLVPPPGFTSVQAELQGAVNDVNTFLKDSQTALANPTRDTMNALRADLSTRNGNLMSVQEDSANRREKASLGLPQVGVDGPLSDEETAYLRKVRALVTRLDNSAVINDALAAFANDLNTLNGKGQVDGKSSAAARAAAISYMSALAPDVRALQAPPRLQAVQTELTTAVQLYAGGFNHWQGAVVSQKWDNIDEVFLKEIGGGLAVSAYLDRDVAQLGIK